jgi:hypothetical protein
MKEEWRDVKDYCGYYQVSNFGRVRGVDRITENNRPIKSSLLKPDENNSGHLRVKLMKKSVGKRFLVHRLVAQAFIPNPKKFPIVNHKDENPSNNKVDNLEWCDVKYNNNYGSYKQRMRVLKSKPIKVIYRDGTYEIWESATVFGKEFGINNSHISDVIHGKRKTVNGLRFEKVD